MSRYVDRIVTTIHEAEEALSEDVRDQQKRWRYDLHRGRVSFDKEMRHAHKQLKQGIPSFLRHEACSTCSPRQSHYSLSLPFVLLDVWGQPVSVDLLSDLRHQSRGAPAVPRDRPSQAWLSECDRESELYVLHVCERRRCVCARSRVERNSPGAPSSMHERSKGLIPTTSCSSTTETLRAIAAGWPHQGDSWPPPLTAIRANRERR